jgi:hypothetical protein
MAIPDTWEAVLKGNSWHVLAKDGRIIATVAKGKDSGANAKLIAASPYMFEALKALTELIGDEDLPDNGELSGAAICDMARAAVSLVTPYPEAQSAGSR